MAKLNVWPVLAAVAAELRANCVPLMMAAMVAPPGMLGLLTVMPGTRPAVLGTVTVVLFAAVEPPVTLVLEELIIESVPPFAP